MEEWRITPEILRKNGGALDQVCAADLKRRTPSHLESQHQTTLTGLGKLVDYARELSSRTCSLLRSRRARIAGRIKQARAWDWTLTPDMEHPREEGQTCNTNKERAKRPLRLSVVPVRLAHDLRSERRPSGRQLAAAARSLQACADNVWQQLLLFLRTTERPPCTGVRLCDRSGSRRLRDAEECSGRLWRLRGAGGGAALPG